MKYIVTWTEVSTHRIELDREEAAELFGVSVERLADLDLNDLCYESLADDLADHDGFLGVTREDIEIERDDTGRTK